MSCLMLNQCPSDCILSVSPPEVAQDDPSSESSTPQPEKIDIDDLTEPSPGRDPHRLLPARGLTNPVTPQTSSGQKLNQSGDCCVVHWRSEEICIHLHLCPHCD